MADFAIRVGSHSAQGVRPNNEDRFVVDAEHHLYMVADGMGGQEHGERASGLAAEIIPRVLHDRLQAKEEADSAVKRALEVANQAILDASKDQPLGRRMGTTTVLALENNGRVYIAGIGDSRAYLIRDDKVEQLTVDHSVAQALVSSGAITPEEARSSPWQNVLHKFLGCANMMDGADVFPFTPQAGDRLLLASDGLTNFITADDLRSGAQSFNDPQSWVERLVQLALDRGSKDNVTGIVIFFEAT
jgi:serine/threonine protein phosphatase PrpC